MAISFQPNGNLSEGVYIMSLENFEKQFGVNNYRKMLINGLKLGMSHLKDCGCKRIFIDGSFVTTKELPGDFDACWDADGVDLDKLESIYGTLLDFSDERKKQKELYSGEFFPAQAPASEDLIYFYFFQQDKDENPKGIVQINLI
ncbi:DUF6932 family protein [Chryseobacterium sp. JAH]|uniref:DUF6932 family protein n=1 Tax=Chryseobacterium sp. JAH TaxID=1742858 RepID=UPI0007412441|nr:hypothetical protein [Chryseobacterium sp. JAH]KUJ49772.1 hypothetical protein AR685_17665 [Chryseobacterium sp. JAH]